MIVTEHAAWALLLIVAGHYDKHAAGALLVIIVYSLVMV